MNRKQKTTPSLNIVNRKALHDYHIIKQFQAGMALEGWEVKSIKAGRAQLKDSYVLIKKQEAWLIGAHFSPLPTTAQYTYPDPSRSRKLLLHRKELAKLVGETQQKGYTLAPLNLHLHKGFIKCQIALVKGKKNYDKRQAEKDKDWTREKARIMKQGL